MSLACRRRTGRDRCRRRWPRPSASRTGALLPLLVVLWRPTAILIPVLAASSLLFLALLGGLAARAGGAPIGAAALRVTFWGALAMAADGGRGQRLRRLRLKPRARGSV